MSAAKKSPKSKKSDPKEARFSILCDQQGDLQRAAVVDQKGTLTDLYLDDAKDPACTGAIYQGRVVRVMGSMNAAFVDIGQKEPALLNGRDIKLRPGVKRRKGMHIGQMIHAGQKVAVQVRADAYGRKGAAVSMDISFPGRFLIYIPLSDVLSISRRMGNVQQQRERIQQLGLPAGGWIVRSSAKTASEAELVAEADWLAGQWLGVQKQLDQEDPKLPRQLQAAPSVYQRALTEAAGGVIEKISVADKGLAQHLQPTIQNILPELADKVEVAGKDEFLFDRFDLEGEIRGLASEETSLKDGGSIVVQQTEALVAIDVNAGDQPSPIAANMAAAEEIARQIRLRNLGGIIVVDFVNMPKQKDRDQLMGHFNWLVSGDPVSTQLYDISRLGLVELARMRRGKACHQLLISKGEG